MHFAFHILAGLVPLARYHQHIAGSKRLHRSMDGPSRVLWQRSPKLYGRSVCLSRGATSQKDCAQRSDDGENEHEDGGLKSPL